MKSGWETKQLCDIAQVKGGKRVPKGYKLQNEPTDHPYLTVSDFGEDGTIDLSNLRYINDKVFSEIAQYTISSEDLYLSIAGTIGKTGSVPVELSGANLTENACKLVFNPGVCKEFVYYFTQSADFMRQAGLNTRVAAQPKLALERLKTITLPVPCAQEQKRIVGILDEAFEGIEKARGNAQKNLQNVRDLFESHLEAVFQQRSQEPVVPIADVAEVFDGPHATPKTVDSGPVFLGIGALQDGTVNLEETRHVTLHDYRKWTRRVRPQPNDVVFSYETRLGQAAIIPEGLECCLGRRMGLVRLDQRRVDPRFFMYQYISPPFRRFLVGRTVRGATVDRISIREFPTFPVAIPPLAEQKRVANLFETLRGQTERLGSIYQQKLAALEELKKSLLHQAFIGAL
ncbi:MAG: restriction endonuclease subunit S [Candidatus Acidiferrum sp.]